MVHLTSTGFTVGRLQTLAISPHLVFHQSNKPNISPLRAARLQTNKPAAVELNEMGDSDTAQARVHNQYPPEAAAAAAPRGY